MVPIMLKVLLSGIHRFMQAYDRAVLRMKGADAATNFPASMYVDLDNAEPSGPLQTADASCTISLPGTAMCSLFMTVRRSRHVTQVMGQRALL